MSAHARGLRFPSFKSLQFSLPRVRPRKVRERVAALPLTPQRSNRSATVLEGGREPARILVAGIGNIFMGDDAFGVEAAQQLMRRGLPEEVRVVDFGIRGYDLAFALMDGYEAVILLDATKRGDLPGTLYLIEPEEMQAEGAADGILDAHSLDPMQVLRLAQAHGGPPSRFYLVGCEPGRLEVDDGQIGLSKIVLAALPRALDMVQSLINDLLGKRQKAKPVPLPALESCHS